ncbi:MAG: hypothetical protein QOE75_227, partial [Solirubrobacterales bacterium]|nr:hypothetical protein [Solirubrobacterales bacterium]
MDHEDKLLFDDWLWEMPQAQLDALELSELASAAAEEGVEFPQISATTAIAEDDVNPVALLASVGVGIDQHRLSSWGGLLRASLKQRRYTVAIRKASDGVLHLMGSVPFTE